MSVERLVEAHEDYKYGFVTDLDADTLPPGLNQDVVRFISAKKGEPEWLLEWRLKALATWEEMEEPTWQNVEYTRTDYQAISYWSAPKKDEDKPQSLDEVDPEILETFEKLGIPLHERARLAGVAVGSRTVVRSASRRRRPRHACPIPAGSTGNPGWTQRSRRPRPARLRPPPPRPV